MKILKIIILFVTLVIAVNTAKSQYKLQSSVFGGGGNMSGGGAYILHGSVYQPYTGIANGGIYYMNVGFWDTYYACAYIMPTVTTQAVTSIASTTATGNGNITNNGGSTPTVRGICWNTSGSPTTSDFKAEETGSFGTGAFTGNITGLANETLYHVRAYATNSAGTAYGNEVTFTTIPMPAWALALFAGGLLAMGMFLIYRRLPV